MKKKILIAFLIIITIYIFFQLQNTKSIQIDKIYVINLDRSTERLAHMQNTLDKLDLPVKYTRLSAFDGKNIELVNKETGERIKGTEFTSNTKLLKGKFDIICAPYWDGGLKLVALNLKFNHRTAGEIGCMCSHMKIWQDIKKNGYKNTLIFEDDVVLSPYFDKYLSIALKFVPIDFDVLYFSVTADYWHYNAKTRNKSLNKITNIFNLVFKYTFFKRIRREAAGTVAYILSQEGVQKLIDNMPISAEGYLTSDRVLGTLITKKILRAYVIKPLMAEQSKIINSSIANINNSR
jgi:GR25 family glycosyltransferase involved in LPS biosynthesis